MYTQLTYKFFQLIPSQREINMNDDSLAMFN